MADPVALVRAASSTAKLADAVKSMWEERTKLRADANGQAWDLVLRAQIDEVFLVLAHLGEAILPLGVFNKDYYLQTLGDVKASLASCGNEMLVTVWEELDAELQYCCCAGLTFCAHFGPAPVYRGFGACVLSDWDWGCPDLAYLEEKARKKAIRTVYGIKQKTDPQPTRSVFEAFDQVIQILQVKPMAFFVKRPPVSGFTEQPRFGVRPKKEVKGDLDLLEDWVHQIVRRGHPMPAGQQTTTWGFPYATWTSESNYYILRSEKDCETLMLNQMDPGRLLHAFVCRRAASLDEHSMYLLLPRSAAESLLCWLEGLPGMNHKIIKWDDLETDAFEKKISKSLRKKIGQYPIPIKHAVRHPNAATRPEPHVSESSPAVLEHPNTVSPPPYSPTNAPTTNAAAAPPLRERAATVPMAELAGPETQELPSETVESPTQPPESAVRERSSVHGLKSIHNLRRKPSAMAQASVASTTATATATTRTPTVLRPGALKGRSSTNRMIEDGSVDQSTPELNAEEDIAVELPAEAAIPAVPARKPVPSVAVQPPVECMELPVPAGKSEIEDSTTAPLPPDRDEPLAINSPASTAVGPGPSPAAAPGASNSDYLELLNKVARGDISPQALAEMLQSGQLGSSTQSIQSSSPRIAMPDAPTPLDAPPKEGPERAVDALPYPKSPSDQKKP